MLRFPHLEEPLSGPSPPTLPQGAILRYRPLIPVRIMGPTGTSRSFLRALVDSGADETIFPYDVAKVLGVTLHSATGHAMRWQGKQFALRYGNVELELIDDSGAMLRWPATVAFSPASIRYPLLGVCGCLEFMNAQFFGESRIVELEPNSSFPGTQTG